MHGQDRRIFSDRGQVNANPDALGFRQPAAGFANRRSRRQAHRVLVTIPSACARRMPRETAFVSP